MILDTPKSFQPGKKDVKYLNKDFGQLRQSLIDFSKVYYPNTYKDFSEASTGMMFIEMSAMVGDVLSYYIDYQFKESVLINSEERKNIINSAKSLGYRVKVSTPSVTELDVYQLVPAAIADDGKTRSPDMRFAQIIKPGMTTTSDGGVGFITNEPVDFTVDTPNNPLEISVYQRNQAGEPEFYVLKKTVPATAGSIITKQVTIGAPTAFYRIPLGEDNVIGILDVYDSDGGRWYETDYLAQDLVAVETENIYKNDNTFYNYRDTTPFLMKFLRTSRRFVVGIKEDNTSFLEFGSGINSQADEAIVPTIRTVGQSNYFGSENTSYDPSNFLTSKSFGQAPGNTTLTIRYITGGGINSNVNANAIKSVGTVEYFGDITELPENEQNLTTVVRRSIRVNNPVPATGGRGPETNEEIKNNAMANFGTQNRVVTSQDYVIRTYGMPSKYGSIAKVYATTDTQLDRLTGFQVSVSGSNSSQSPLNINRPFREQTDLSAINLYVLCYDSNQRLIKTNPAMQHNLKTYLDQYRMLTDSIRIIDGFVINIGVEFSIIVYKNYNKRDVLANAINLVRAYFNVENTQFCQPINLSRLKLEIGKLDGVQTVSSVKIKNLTARDGDYSTCEYNIDKATVDDVVYPSLDPSIFEVRYPTKDIVGRVL
jgi:hypothetical protein